MNLKLFRVVALNESTDVENPKKSVVVPGDALHIFLILLLSTSSLGFGFETVHSDVSSLPVTSRADCNPLNMHLLSFAVNRTWFMMSEL